MTFPDRSTRLLVRVGVVLSFSMLLGCSLLKKKKPEADDDTVSTAPTVTVGGTGAKNEKDVLRYANETAIADEPGTIGKDGTKAKTFPGSGGDVATLAKGAAVVKKAKFFSTGVLVVFDDPTTNDGTKLLGWIPPEALGAAPAASATATTTTVFTAPKLDSGKPPDAGTGVDASSPGKPADAGAVVLVPGAPLTALPVAGKCPTGFALFPPTCRRPCNQDKDCPTNSVCAQSFGPKKSCSLATH